MKNKKYIALIILCFSVLMLSACGVKKNPRVVVNGHEIQVETATTPQQRFQGLSDRQSLAEDTGMLFVFPDYQKRNFIMRDMNFSLDIVWIKDNQVASCAENVPIYDNQGDFSIVTSPSPVNYVLELNAGSCAKYAISSGVKIDINY